MTRIISVILILPFLLACNTGKQVAKEKISNQGDKAITNAPDTLSFTISEANNIIFESVLDERDTIRLFFDTGGTELVMTTKAIENRTSLLKDKNEDYTGESYVPLEDFHSLSLGDLTWDSLTIYPARIGPEEADGHFGWDLFEDKIVELDYEKQLMIIHDTFKGDLNGYSNR